MDEEDDTARGDEEDDTAGEGAMRRPGRGWRKEGDVERERE